MFLLWNMDKRICRLCDGDPFKSVVESYLPFATPSSAKDERHICSQRVSSSRQDPFPLSSSSDPHVSEKCRTSAHTVITRVDGLPVHPHLITPLSLRQLAWWEKKGLEAERWKLRTTCRCVSFIRDGGMEDEKQWAHTPWLRRHRRGTRSEGLTYWTLSTRYNGPN